MTMEITLTVLDQPADVAVEIIEPPDITISVAETGPPGPAGPTGPRGPAGSDPTIYPFASPAATWTITHNLGRYPILELIDPTGAVFDADVEFPDLNTAVVTHAQPATGSVLIS